MILLPFGKAMEITLSEGLHFPRLILRADGPARLSVI
jgi:hypothetical protein